MNSIQYILSALIVYLGSVVGIIVMHASKEEQKTARQYFGGVRVMLFSLMIGVLFVFMGLNMMIGIIILAALIIYLATRIKAFDDSIYWYIITGLVIFASGVYPLLFLIESTISFAYIMISVSEGIDFKKKNYIQIAIKPLFFLATALIFLIVF